MSASGRNGTLADIGEFGFLARLLPLLPGGAGVVVGPGDDAAVVEVNGTRLLLTTDAIVEGVHFRQGWMTPRQIGRKAYLVNASDIAAMGGRPRFCVVSTGAPPHIPVRSLSALHRGIADAAAETGALLVGGNLSRAEELFVSVTLVGESKRPVTRAGAQPGDLLFVSGTLGLAAAGLHALLRDRRASGSAVTRFREPVPRLHAGAALARAGVVSAMIDVSDGLLQDLHHICEASGVGAQIELEKLPRPRNARTIETKLLLSGGEDYELLCAVPERRAAQLRRLVPRLGCPLTWIGRVMPKTYGVHVRNVSGDDLEFPQGGFDHFAAARRR
jgi:thiamine-monophosphate kinase